VRDHEARLLANLTEAETEAMIRALKRIESGVVKE